MIEKPSFFLHTIFLAVWREVHGVSFTDLFLSLEDHFG